jgi:hypothetical protein
VDRAQETHAVEHGHLQVGQDHVERLVREDGEGGLAVRRVRHRVAGALEVLGERARHVDLVLDEEDACAHAAVGGTSLWQGHGSSTVNVVPTPISLATRTSPP